MNINNKNIIIALLIIGSILIIIGITKRQTECPKQKIIYKYIPRTFEEEQDEPVYVSDIFETMFSQPSPWIVSATSLDNRRQLDINKYFVSQA